MKQKGVTTMKIGIVLLIIICVIVALVYRTSFFKNTNNDVRSGDNKTTIEDEKHFVNLISNLAEIYRNINE